MRLCITLAACGLLGACASTHGKASLDALGIATVDALGARDVARYRALRATRDHYAAACPMFAGMWTQARARRDAYEPQLVEDYGTCARADWQAATDIVVSGGFPAEAGLGCERVVHLEPMSVRATIDGVVHQALVVSSVLVDGRFFVVTAPICTDDRHAAVHVAERFAEQACACSDADCAMQAAEEFGRSMQEAAADRRPGTDADREAIHAASARGNDCMLKLSPPQ